MSAVTFRLQPVAQQPEHRPESCLHCGSRVLQGWGWETKEVRDVGERRTRVTVHRYRCDACGRTFRQYPAGVDQADLSIGVRQLAGVLWGLGLRLSQVMVILDTLGASMGSSSAWRAGQEIGRSLRKTLQARFVPVLADDQAELGAILETLGFIVRLLIAPEVSVIVGVVEAGPALRRDLLALGGVLDIDVRFLDSTTNVRAPSNIARR